MIRVFLVILLYTAAPILAQESINHIDSQGKKQGVWKKNYPHHTLRYEGEFKNDIPINTFRYYYEDGKLQAEIRYSENGKRGEAVLFNKDEIKIAEGVYIEQKKEGEWHYFDEKTQLIRSSEAYKNGLPDGKWLVYYDDGKTVSEFCEWENGEREGIRCSFFENGNKKQEMSYRNGKAEGPIKYYHANGSLRGIGQYKNNQREGVWTYYDESGEVTVSDIYENGEVIKNEEDMNNE